MDKGGLHIDKDLFCEAFMQILKQWSDAKEYIFEPRNLIVQCIRFPGMNIMSSGFSVSSYSRGYYSVSLRTQTYFRLSLLDVCVRRLLFRSHSLNCFLYYKVAHHVRYLAACCHFTSDFREEIA